MDFLQKRTNAFILSFIFLSLFVLFSFWVNKGFFKQFDFDTTVRLQDKIPHHFDFPFSLFSLLGSVEFTLFLIVTVFGFLLLKKKKIFLGIISFFFIFIIELAGKVIIFHPAPPHMFFRYMLGFSFPSSYIHTNYSYPSGHMARSSFFLIIGLFLIQQFVLKKINKRVWSCVIIIFTIVMFISRVYLGEHWFTDVLGGFFLGAGLGTVALIFW